MADFLTDDPSENLYTDFENVTVRITVPDGEIYDFLVNSTRFMAVSSFFVAYCRNHSELTSCSLCNQHHAYSTLCIPAYFDPEAILCLLNLINGHIPSFDASVDSISFIKIAGFLLIQEEWIEKHFFSFKGLGTRSLRRSCTTLFELYRNGYCSLATKFSIGIQWPLLRLHNSARSYYRHCRRIQRRDRRFFLKFHPLFNNPWAVRAIGNHHLDYFY